ncbi:fungal-specific transcription factor domain-domain-containing protein [Microdochium bolleyi]|uniref:Fungal-specific transcription factor domain-domain-containing protein n=1 Tax=Microdochium bolleyi TaxID=196109 RepID=A0A136IM72_9PEZI|nr:fungal-specific transcription factor domain-domain-containing protein [Microdochium bolleyi]
MLSAVLGSDHDRDTAAELDRLLAELDSQATALNQEEPTWQHVQGPFGVFSATQSKVSSPEPQNALSEVDHIAGTWESLDAYGGDLDGMSLFTSGDDLSSPIPAYGSLSSSGWTGDNTTITLERGTIAGIDHLLEETFHASVLQPNERSPAWQLQPTEPAIPAALSSQALPAHASPYLPSCAQYLLWHYSNHTIPSLSGIPVHNETSIWKRLHLPTALRAYAELGVLGDSSLPRVSLLYSLMSIACFQLRSLHKDGLVLRQGSSMGVSAGAKFTPESWTADEWETEGQKFRNIAQRGLQKFLGDTKTPEALRKGSFKYKEVLVAAVSLVCIQIISGDTRNARSDILQCEQVIRMKPGKRRPSRKTSDLHEMFFYIQVIESASSAQPDPCRAKTLMPDDRSSGLDSHDAELVTRPVGPLQDEHSELVRVTPSELCLEDADGEEDVMYGLPSSLLHLLGRTTALINKIEASPDPHRGACTSAEIEETASRLENDICAWPGQRRKRCGGDRGIARDALTTSSTAPPDNSSSRDPDQSLPGLMTSCLAQALHSAILIHFFRTVRRTHPAILQHYVKRVTRHLETHASLRTASAPARINAIVWPSFVAACEAADADLRRRGIACLRQAAWAGFCNWEAAERVTRETWRRRDAGDPTASWQQVVRDLAVRMVLT